MNDNNGAIIMVDFENVGLGGLEGYELLNSNVIWFMCKLKNFCVSFLNVNKNMMNKYS